MQPDNLGFTIGADTVGHEAPATDLLEEALEAAKAYPRRTLHRIGYRCDVTDQGLRMIYHGRLDLVLGPELPPSPAEEHEKRVDHVRGVVQ